MPRLVLLLPAATMACVCWLLLWGASPVEVRGARLSGGPSEAEGVLALRLELVARLDGTEWPLPKAAWTGTVELSEDLTQALSGTITIALR